MNNNNFENESLNVGLSLQNQRKYSDAIELYKNIILSNPDSIDAHNMLCNCYFELGDYQSALYHGNIACSLTEDPAVLNNRGRVLISIGQLECAISDFKKASKRAPEMFELYNNICFCYHQLRDYRKAVQFGEMCLRLNPDFTLCRKNLIRALYELENYEEVLVHLGYPGVSDDLQMSHYIIYSNYKLKKHNVVLDNVCKLYRIFPENLNILFIGLHVSGMHARTDISNELLRILHGNHTVDLAGCNHYLDQDIFFSSLHKALLALSKSSAGPDCAFDIYNRIIVVANASKASLLVNLGVLYFDLGDFDNANVANLRALAIDKSQYFAYNNLGVISLARKNYKAAIDNFNNAIALNPNLKTSLGWLLKAKLDICDWANLDALVSMVRESIENGEVCVSGVTLLSIFDEPDLQLKAMTQIASKTFIDGGDLFNYPVSAAVPKKIKLGFYSYDFRDHPVAHLTNRIFELIDRNVFTVFTYSYGPDDGSQARANILRHSDVFRDFNSIATHDIAQNIIDDDIDILIDLSGDTYGNRSEIFQYSLAKFKIHWLGFIGTMGSKFYDYIIADGYTITYSDERYYAERVLRINPCFHLCDDGRNLTEAPMSKYDFGINPDSYVYGVFSQMYKIQPMMLDAWIDILKKVPNSCMLIAEGAEEAVGNIINYFNKQGVGDRVKFTPRVHVQKYLSQFSAVDLILDTYPYSSGTVASDAVMNACPILTLSGSTMAARMSSSIAMAAGLEGFVTYSLEEYISKGVECGMAPLTTSKARFQLEESRRSGLLLNSNSFVKEFERKMVDMVKGMA